MKHRANGNSMPAGEPTGPAPSGPPPDRAARRVRVPRWALAAGAAALVVAGLVGGGAIVTVTGISAKQSVQVVVSPSPVPVTPTAASSSGVTGQVGIGAACVRAIDQVQSVYQLLQATGTAAAHLDLNALDRLVRQLQDMRVALGNNLSQCRATVQLPPGSGAGSSASPALTPAPSSS